MSENNSDDVFRFEHDSLESDQTMPREILGDPRDLPLGKALESAGEAAYCWDVVSDALTWSENAHQVLACPAENIGSGKRFAAHMDPENLTSRYDAVMHTQKTDEGQGVPFHLEYLFKPQGRNGLKSIWVEDHGRWYAGADGKPASVLGTLRPINDRHQREQHLNFLGNCDPLTGMMNRGRMTEALGEAITVATREHHQCAFAIAAVNNLAVVNEAYGFEVADEVIVALGQRLREVMRSGDGIARYSGGKFGIILNNCSEDELIIALERFLAVVRESVIETKHGPVWAMLSIGALSLPSQAHDANTATARAEEALNEARRLPSDGYVIYKPSDVRSNERKLNARCATEIVKCLKGDQFKLAFQPIVSATTGQVVLHEALLRMADENTNELIAAQHLMPVSERLGLVRLIDRSVTQMIVNTLHQYPDAHLAMNVSATTATDPRWYNQLLEIISENSQVAHRLTVEITETVALNDIEATRYFVENLRRSNCKVAIDDFGAGFTSFRNLRDLQVDMIKLDGSFCNNLRDNPENEYFVRSLIDMGKKFKLKTVAEWIEFEDDANLLAEWGIDLLQGHLIGKASIVPPWQKVEESLFSLSTAAPPIRNIEVEAEIEVAVETQPALAEVVVNDAVEIQDAPVEDSADEATPDESAVVAIIEARADVLAAEIETETIVETEVTEMEMTEMEAQPASAVEVQVASPDVETDSLDLNFDGIDESIFALKKTLESLRAKDAVVEPQSDRSAA